MEERRQGVNLLERLSGIAVALSAEKNHDILLEKILLEAKEIANADGGTLYLRTEDDHLEFSIVRTDSLSIAMGGSTGKKPVMGRIPLHLPSGESNFGVQAVYAVLKNKPVNIDDVYDASGFDFKGTKEFDSKVGYRTKSVITIPMENQTGRVIGALQLINSKNALTGEVVPFSPETVKIVHALASLAAVTLTNQILIEQQKELLESFIKVIADAIDRKSPYTGAHCSRVPMLCDMIAEAACKENDGYFRDFNLNEDELYELHIAGWLHDCGKITTPVHIMDKATKLETIFDRINLVKARFEILKRDAEIEHLKSTINKSDYENKIAQIADDLKFIENANIGGEFMDDDKIARINQIAKIKYSLAGEEHPLLGEEEVYNLSTRRGTLTKEEMEIMKGHMVSTMHMLENLPFPPHLRRVPEYAIGHHEKMDGTGYPRGIPAGEMSIPARMMAIADVFEALTASDRPYKKPKTLSESLKIMAFMKKDNHLDPDILDFFMSSGIYLEYAKQVLAPEQIDEVNIDELLAIRPKPLEIKKGAA